MTSTVWAQYIEWLLSTFSNFLMSEPIFNFTVGILVIEVFKLFKLIISRKA